METLLHLLLGVVLYGMVAEHTDRAADRQLNARRTQTPTLHLIVSSNAVGDSDGSTAVARGGQSVTVEPSPATPSTVNDPVTEPPRSVSSL